MRSGDTSCTSGVHDGLSIQRPRHTGLMVPPADEDEPAHKEADPPVAGSESPTVKSVHASKGEVERDEGNDPVAIAKAAESDTHDQANASAPQDRTDNIATDKGPDSPAEPTGESTLSGDSGQNRIAATEATETVTAAGRRIPWRTPLLTSASAICGFLLAVAGLYTDLLLNSWLKTTIAVLNFILLSLVAGWTITRWESGLLRSQSKELCW